LTIDRRVVAVYVQFGFETYASSFTSFVSLLEEIFPQSYIDVYLVENRADILEGTSIRHGKTNIFLTNGDNSFREFSAWNSVFSRYIENASTDDTIVILATSAFLELFTGYIDHFKNLNFKKLIGVTFAVGHLDYMDEACSVMKKEIKYWLRTSILFTNVRSLKRLDDLYLALDEKRVLANLDGKEDGIFDENYRNHILNWLVRKIPMQNVTWHRIIDINDEEELVNKTISILNEVMLTQNFLSSNIKLFDVGHLTNCKFKCAHNPMEQIIRRGY
jgi:hypothetical protein